MDAVGNMASWSRNSSSGVSVNPIGGGRSAPEKKMTMSPSLSLSTAIDQCM